MNNEEILLSVLYKFKEFELRTEELYGHVEGSISWDVFLKILDDFHKTGILDKSIDDNKISNIGINKYNTLLSTKGFNEKEEQLKKVDRKINNLSLVVSSLLACLSFILSIYIFINDNKLGKQEVQIEKLQKQINEYKKTIDSLLISTKDHLPIRK